MSHPTHELDLLRCEEWREVVAVWRRQDPQRTLRWLAGETGFALGHVSEMLSVERRRPPAPGFIERLSARMALPPLEHRLFEALVRRDSADEERRRKRHRGDRAGEERCRAEAQAAEEDVRLVSAMIRLDRDGVGADGLIDRWVAAVVHEALALPAARRAPGVLAERLLPAASTGDVRDALEWLVGTGLAARSSESYEKGEHGIIWFDADDSADERRTKMLEAHRRALAHYLWCLDTANVPRDDRSYRMVFQALPRAMLPEVVAKVDELLAWIHDRAEQRGVVGDPDVVYLLGFQAVPLTRRGP